jgi:hypothetical protein
MAMTARIIGIIPGYEPSERDPDDSTDGTEEWWSTLGDEHRIT